LESGCNSSVIAIFIIPVSFDIVERIAHRKKKYLQSAPEIVPTEGD